MGRLGSFCAARLLRVQGVGQVADQLELLLVIQAENAGLRINQLQLPGKQGGLKEQVQQLVKKSERANSEIERDAASEASRSFGV